MIPALKESVHLLGIKHKVGNKKTHMKIGTAGARKRRSPCELKREGKSS